MQKHFEYSYTHQLTEDEYITIVNSYSFVSNIFRVVGFAIVGIACLFSWYTFILGVIILVSIIIKIFLPKLVQRGLQNDYQKRRILKQPISYSVTDSELRLSSDGISYESSWNHLVSWKEQAGWLILKPSGVDALYFRVSDMKKAGIYDSVIEHAEKYSGKYRS